MAAENRVKAVAAGGIDAIVRAMNTHINNADVCEYGCCALCNMAINRSKLFCIYSAQMHDFPENIEIARRTSLSSTLQRVKKEHPDLSDKIEKILERVSRA